MEKKTTRHQSGATGLGLIGHGGKAHYGNSNLKLCSI